MGVKIYNEADLEVLAKLKAAANADVKKTIKSLGEIQSDNDALAEAIATMYEDSIANREKTDEVLATIYETILEGRA
ncbi:hypothetical protein [Peptoniphilus obesi]|uniref:hypothetical protein n=1 Tax=Peptoniphilus obesi TaxID=1472765 RepID=UPI0004B61B8E|nr:hypothetical protein [Peptoniphilus obesi]